MKALVRKDFYVLWQQMRLFLIVILFLSLIPSSFNRIFAIFYATMIPFTAAAYDERSHWDQLAAMMPYSIRDLVMSKYLLGWLFIIGAALLSLLAQIVFRLFLSDVSFSPQLIFVACCCAICIEAFLMPLLFRFRVEKSRMLMFLLIFLVCGGSGILSNAAILAPDTPAFSLHMPALTVLAILTAALSLGSIPLSIRQYQKRQQQCLS